jgi:F-type H+-transporting ATPase subunit b
MRAGRGMKRSIRSGIQNGRQANGRETTGGGRGVWLFFFICLFCGFFMVTAVHASGGGGGDEGPNWFGFTWRVVNFLILIGVLYWLLADKIKSFLSARREGIRTALAEAVTAREEAEQKFREYAAKLDKATGEIDEIKQMIQVQGLTEKERIIEDARNTAKKMKEDTQARMEQEFNKASRELRIEAVRLSTEMAEELLRKNIRANDHEALVTDYIEKVVNKN